MAPRRNPRGYKSWRDLQNHRHRNYHCDRDAMKINESCDCSYPVYNRKNCIHRVRSRRRRRRRLSKKLNIPKLVYKFLGNVASLESENNEVNSSRTNFKRSSGIKKPKKQPRNPDAIHVATNRESNNDESRTSVSSYKSSQTNSTICKPGSTPLSTTSGVDTKQKFSIQAIKDYIRAGIAEGKRRAKKYMCKALSFGVDTGYLIPADTDGKVLRVSSALVNFTTGQKDNGERGIRQRLRRGDATCTSQERRLLRRRGDAAVPQKRPRSPSSIGSSSASSRKQSPGRKRKKPRYGNRIRRYKSKRSKNRKYKRGPGRPRGRISSAKMNVEKSCTCVKLEKEEGSERNGNENCQEETLTPSRSEVDNGKSIKKEKLSYPSIGGKSSEGTGAKTNK